VRNVANWSTGNITFRIVRLFVKMGMGKTRTSLKVPDDGTLKKRHGWNGMNLAASFQYKILVIETLSPAFCFAFKLLSSESLREI